MSKFYEAMERSANRMPEEVVIELEETEHLEVFPETLYEPDADEFMTPVSLVVEPEHEGLLDQSIEQVGREEREAPGPVREPAKFDLAEKPVHPAYERIIQKLLASRRSPRQGVILVAGAVPREGASTIARNTALTLGRGLEEHVVLVDANLRAPSQHTAFQVDISEGLSDVLRGPTSLTSAVKADVAVGLSLLTAGRPVESPPQLLTMTSLQGISMALTSLFNWVVIDGPPLTAYPEGASLAAAAGGAILVVRAERTRQEVTEEAKRVLEDAGVDVLGAVLNRRKYHIPDFVYRRL